MARRKAMKAFTEETMSAPYWYSSANWEKTEQTEVRKMAGSMSLVRRFRVCVVASI